MLSNTQTRLISGLVLVAILSTVLLLGKEAFQLFIMHIGFLVINEINNNFLKNNKRSLQLLLGISLFATTYLLVMYFSNMLFLQVVLYFALIINLTFLIFLFYSFDQKKTIVGVLKNKIILISFVYGLIFSSIHNLFISDLWLKYFLFIVVLNSMSDIGAWFVGRRWGKNKLCPSISPNKTVEGALGGIVFSTLISTIAWSAFFKSFSYINIVLFIVLIVVSQTGDLVQSKIKRVFDIKDSSNLIPGHGGVYDRIDSLLYTLPFFLFFLNYLFKVQGSI